MEMESLVMYKFLQNNEWKYLINVFRFYFRDANKNIKTWKVDQDDRWEDTVVMLTAMQLAMDGLEQAVTANNMAGIRLYESAIRTQIHDVMQHFAGRITSFRQLFTGGYNRVKMEYATGISHVECHRLFGGVKFTALHVLLMRIYVVLEGANPDSPSNAWLNWAQGPSSFKYQVPGEPVPQIPVFLPNGDLAVAVPLTWAPNTEQREAEEREYLDVHQVIPTPSQPSQPRQAHLSSASHMRSLLRHMNQMTGQLE